MVLDIGGTTRLTGSNTVFTCFPSLLYTGAYYRIQPGYCVYEMNGDSLTPLRVSFNHRVPHWPHYGQQHDVLCRNEHWFCPFAAAASYVTNMISGHSRTNVWSNVRYGCLLGELISCKVFRDILSQTVTANAAAVSKAVLYRRRRRIRCDARQIMWP